jgi:hypothetical protein
MSHEGFRFDDYHLQNEFWSSLNGGWLDMSWKWEFEVYWGKEAKPEPIYLTQLSQEVYDKLQEMIAEPPELNPKLIELGEKWMLENDETLRRLVE